MATTCYFEKTIRDKEDKGASIDLEFGRSSYYGESLIYFNIDGNSVIVDNKTGQEIYEAMRRLATYLGYETD